MTDRNRGELGNIDRVLERPADKKQYLLVIRRRLLGLFKTEILISLENVSIGGERIVLRDVSPEQLDSFPQFDPNIESAYRRLEDHEFVLLREDK